MAAKFKKNILMWLLWLIMIIIWNYVWPQANPSGCISFCDFRCRFSCFKEISKNLILVPQPDRTGDLFLTMEMLYQLSYMGSLTDNYTIFYKRLA